MVKIKSLYYIYAFFCLIRFGTIAVLIFNFTFFVDLADITIAEIEEAATGVKEGEISGLVSKKM